MDNPIVYMDDPATAANAAAASSAARMDGPIILFDLDGTLTDSKEGIVNSVRYALRQMGAPIPSEQELLRFIGPPLVDSFRTCCGFDDERAWEAVRCYREYFSEKGLMENAPYAGVKEMLARLAAAGARMSIATSKPTLYAKRIARGFGFADRFDHIVGSNLDGTRVDKGEVIQCAMGEYPDAAPDDFVMVGDRKHDMMGAARWDVSAIGVLYGYGSREELEACRPAKLVESVRELEDALLHLR